MINKNSLSNNQSEEAIRKSLWRQWSIVIALLVWVMWFTADYHNSKSVLIPVVFTLVGMATGWVFGYKLGFGLVFSNTCIFSVERVIEPTEKK